MIARKIHGGQERSSCARVRPNKSDSEEALFLFEFPLILDKVIHSKQI